MRVRYSPSQRRSRRILLRDWLKGRVFRASKWFRAGGLEYQLIGLIKTKTRNWKEGSRNHSVIVCSFITYIASGGHGCLGNRALVLRDDIQ